MSCSLILNSNISQAKSFGEKIGLFFQLKNDIEETSALNDMKNDIYTIKDILGVEKSAILLDNYKKDIREFLNNLPDNIIRRELEDLIICL